MDFRNKFSRAGAAILIWIVMLCVMSSIATVSAGMKDFIHLLGIKMNSYVLKSVIERNELVDRPQKDWALDKGHAVV